MKALFAKRLFVRLATGVWIVVAAWLVLLSFGVLTLQGMTFFVNQPGVAEQFDPQTVAVFRGMSAFFDGVLPVFALLTVTSLLGMASTMTMSQDIRDTYSHRTYTLTSAKIAANMGYEPTMARTREMLDRTMAAASGASGASVPAGAPADGMPAPTGAPVWPAPSAPAGMPAPPYPPRPSRNGEAS
ncbi:hypothetical protein JS531_05725 [Bifidobacterium sp. CP2]|uniref:hypothetical protein n=1 Tax=Bifidobacterium sp. CP2 TaxID=2809025 RepID=UPI001BDCA560|nr:hypothetical protein [Bifidobacterium sp. CP2]MBT1181470.1 hypothetical protein [Bifidobacterium sp. CP2]